MDFRGQFLVLALSFCHVDPKLELRSSGLVVAHACAEPSCQPLAFSYVVQSSQFFSVFGFSRWEPKGPEKYKVTGPKSHSES